MSEWPQVNLQEGHALAGRVPARSSRDISGGGAVSKDIILVSFKLGAYGRALTRIQGSRGWPRCGIDKSKELQEDVH